MATDRKHRQRPDYPSADEIAEETQRHQPGDEFKMETKPIYHDETYKGSQRLDSKVALITGGDSGIGRAVAIAYAKEGAKVYISYKEEHEDAEETAAVIASVGGESAMMAGDISDPQHVKAVVSACIERFGAIDILVNNAAEQYPVDSILDITRAQLEGTFATNIFAMFYFVQEALPHMREGSTIINTTSVTAYRGNPQLIDYSATKGAIVAFTRSLASSLAKQKIRVNMVAPGPIWTPLIPATFDEEKVAAFGEDTLMERPGQPLELAEAYVFLAWERASSFITGECIHINGGDYISS